MSETASLPQPIEVSRGPESADIGRLARVGQKIGETSLQFTDFVRDAWQDDLGPKTVHAMDAGYDVAKTAVKATGRGAKKAGTKAVTGSWDALKGAGRFAKERVFERVVDEGATAVRGIRKHIKDGPKKLALTKYYWREETLRGADGTAPGWGGKGKSMWDRKIKHGLIDTDKVIKRSAADALHGDNKPYQKARKETGADKPPVLSFWERRMHSRRGAQQHKLNVKRARAYNLEQTFGSNVGMTTKQKRQRGVPLEDRDLWDRRAARGGGKEYRGIQRRISTGGRTQATMGYERLARAAQGDTIFGRRRSRRIRELERKQASERQRLGIRR